PIGSFGIRSGPMMAAADYISIRIEGKGAHAARPHLGIDTVLVAAHIITAIQSIVARNVDPVKSGVISITMGDAGNRDNVIPQVGRWRGPARTFDPDVRDMIEERLGKLVESTAAAFGATATLRYKRNYPVLVNHDRETGFAASVASSVAGPPNVDTALPP